MYGPQESIRLDNSCEINLEMPTELPKGHQKLTANKLFEQEIPPIGKPHVYNIDGILEPYERLMFFGQLLANEHRLLYSSPEPGMSTKREMQGREIYYSFWYENDKLNWQLGNEEPQTGTIFDMIGYLYGRDLLEEQVGMLVAELKFDFTSLSEVNKMEKRRLINGEKLYHDYLPKKLNMYDVTKQLSFSYLQNCVDIYGTQNELLESILTYEWDDRYFCVPACLEEPLITYTGQGLPALTIGKHIAPAIFINQNYFSKYPNATIFFCQDIRLAIKLDTLLEKITSYNPADFFVTSIFGNNFSEYNWKYLYRRHIIFFPEPTTKSLAIVKNFKEYCELTGYGKFSISSNFILPYLKAESTAIKISQAEEYILNHSTPLEEIKDIINFLKDQINNANSIEEFTKIYKWLHIFQHNLQNLESEKEQNITESFAPLPVEDPQWVLPAPNNLGEVKINYILKPSNLVFLIGIKNAGKTHLSYLLIKSALHIEKDLPLFSSNYGKPFTNIMLVDGESDKDKIESYLKQHSLIHEVGKSLFIVSRFMGGFPKWIDEFYLTDSRIRDWLKSELIKKQCRILVLDNLTDLLGAAVNYQSKSDEIIKWIREIQLLGVCVIIYHHKSEDSPHIGSTKTDGSQIFKKLARTIINIHGDREPNGVKLWPDKAKNKTKEEGLTAGIEFYTCKSAPLLEKYIFWVHLPMNQTQWEYLCTTRTDYTLCDIAFLSTLPTLQTPRQLSKSTYNKIMSFVVLIFLRQLKMN